MEFKKYTVEGQVYKSPLEQKIKEIIARKGLTIKDLYEKADLDEGTIYNVFKNGNGRPKTLKKIADALEISVRDLQVKAVQFAANQDLPDLEYKSGRLLPVEKTKLYLSQLPDKEAEMYVPYYDVEITAGKPGIEIYFDEGEDERPDGYVYAPNYPGCIMCNVKGNSMYDLIYPGARLYVYKMEDLKYIDFGQIYVIVTNSLRVLKYIKRHPTDNTMVRLVPHNNPEEYWDVEKADIIHLFLVKAYENQTSM